MTAPRATSTSIHAGSGKTRARLSRPSTVAGSIARRRRESTGASAPSLGGSPSSPHNASTRASRGTGRARCNTRKANSRRPWRPRSPSSWATPLIVRRRCPQREMSALLRDPARLEALARAQLMDSEPEEVFDRLTRLATKLLGTPVATMTLVDDRRQYFKSSVGTGVNETPLSHSFCQHVVTGAAPLVVTDARSDPRVKDNGAVEDLDVIAYCGVPLTDADGHTLGSFCAIEHTPRELTDIEIEILTELAHNIMTELDLRAANRALIAREHETRSIIESAHDAFIAVDADHLIVDWNPAAERLFGWSAGEAVGTYLSETVLPDLSAGYGLERPASAAADLPSLPVEVTARHRDGHALEVEVSIARVETPDGPRFNALVRDIAERRAAQVQREQLARVVESTNDAVITVAPV